MELQMNLFQRTAAVSSLLLVSGGLTTAQGASETMNTTHTVSHSENRASDTESTTTGSSTRFATETIDGLEIFYREAGTPGQPQLVLLHGFPTSSHMYRDLIDDLSDDFHIIAPDYPGFGLSSAPSSDDYEYTFDNLAGVVDELLERKGFDDYFLYVMDYGAPVGYRIATEHPERVAGFVVQNGNAYDEGLEDFWNPIKQYWSTGLQEDREALSGLLTLEATKWQYLTGVRDESIISPDNWLVIQPLLDREGNKDVQLDLFYDYGTNPPLYPSWQEYFRTYQPPMLITWGANDPIFPEPGAHPYLRDLTDAELHILDTGHFALEEDGQLISELIRDFIHRNTD
jgi:pimeloyl-ACP methyl ester carboxylesterase